MRRHGRETEFNGTVLPERVFLLDQRDLPIPLPSFKLLLACDRRRHALGHLEMDEPVDVIALCKTPHGFGSMLVHSRGQIGRHADVERSVAAARQNVDARLPVHLARMPRSWMLN